MEPEDGELLEAEGKSLGAAELILVLRRVIYRCELLQIEDFSDGTRQSLWESVVMSYDRCFTAGRIGGIVERLGPAHAATRVRLARERARLSVGTSTVIPDSICELDLQSGPLAEPDVNPAAARSLAEALIVELSR